MKEINHSNAEFVILCFHWSLLKIIISIVIQSFLFFLQWCPFCWGYFCKKSVTCLAFVKVTTYISQRVSFCRKLCNSTIQWLDFSPILSPWNKMSEFVLNSKDIQMNIVNCRLFGQNWTNVEWLILNITLLRMETL